jgi:hypothetical protein
MRSSLVVPLAGFSHARRLPQAEVVVPIGPESQKSAGRSASLAGYE